MKHIILAILSIILLATIEAKPKKKIYSLPSFHYVVKGYEAYYVSANEIQVIGPDLNSVITLTSDNAYLEQDAIFVVDSLSHQAK